MTELVPISRALCREISRLTFRTPVTHVYNPIDYARAPFEDYLERYGDGSKRILFLGMNPGPFGMTQTGVPFGDVKKVRDWLKIEGLVHSPDRPHPARPVQGFSCPRSEVSGTRFWGWVENQFGTPENFFSDHFVWNYCPLVFMEKSGKNRTPDQLPRSEAIPLEAACQKALQAVTAALETEVIVTLGRFAEKQAAAALKDAGVRIEYLLHPSPMSPLANREWDQRATTLLKSV